MDEYLEWHVHIALKGQWEFPYRVWQLDQVCSNLWFDGLYGLVFTCVWWLSQWRSLWVDQEVICWNHLFIYRVTHGWATAVTTIYTNLSTLCIIFKSVYIIVTIFYLILGFSTCSNINWATISVYEMQSLL